MKNVYLRLKINFINLVEIITCELIHMFGNNICVSFYKKDER